MASKDRTDPPTQADLSLAEARRLALSSMGFGRVKPSKPGLAQLRALATRLHQFQIDSVNVLVRAHYMPAFSRLGPYHASALDDLAYRKRELFEFWGHAACLIRTDLYPLLRFRMESHAAADYWARASHAERAYVESVLAEITERGPLSASEITDSGKAKGPWWGWSDGKEAVETLWRTGRLAVAGRRRFERVYDLPERVIPRAILEQPCPSRDEAQKHLLVAAAGTLGVATAWDLSQYFHVESWWDRPRVDGKRRKSELTRLVNELVEEKRLAPTTVQAWRDRAYTLPGVKIPARIDACAIVSPFDPLMWDRVDRADGYWSQRLFGMDYRIEIYVPEPKRVYGYYCLMFLLGDRFVARVDLKADRKASSLVVAGAFLEPAPRDVPVSKLRTPHEVAAALAAELRSMANWLNLDTVSVGERGDLAAPLAHAVRPG